MGKPNNFLRHSPLAALLLGFPLKPAAAAGACPAEQNLPSTQLPQRQGMPSCAGHARPSGAEVAEGRGRLPWAGQSMGMRSKKRVLPMFQPGRGHA
jgi:hypothetical protein